MSKSFWGVIAVIALAFIAILAFSGNKSGDSSSKNSSSSSATLTNHVEGLGKSGVTLTEYGDYQCPFCGEYYATVKQVQTEFNDQIHFQFRNYPLVNNHPNAFAAARAAEAAALQNKFWEMHDVLYQTQSQWSDASDPTTYFSQYAKQLGLNTAQYQTDFASSKVNDLINADMAEGNKLAIAGTPTFFVDGKKVDIGNTPAAFEKVIKAAIAKKTPESSGTTEQTQAAPPATSPAPAATTTQ